MSDGDRGDFRGTWFITLRRYLGETYGAAAVDTVRARLRPDTLAVFDEAMSSDWYPEPMLQDALAAVMAEVAHDDEAQFLRLLEGATVHGIHRFMQAAAGLVSPAFALRRMPTFLKLTRRGSGAIDVQTGRSSARLVYHDFPYFDELNYRLLVLGNLGGLLSLCSRRATRLELVDHSRTRVVIEVDY